MKVAYTGFEQTGVERVVLDKLRKAKISQLEHSVVNQYVRRLQISMDYSKFQQLLKAIDDLKMLIT